MRLKNLQSSDITATGLRDERTAPIILEEYREQASKRMENDVFMNILAGYIKSII